MNENWKDEEGKAPEVPAGEPAWPAEEKTGEPEERESIPAEAAGEPVEAAPSPIPPVEEARAEPVPEPDGEEHVAYFYEGGAPEQPARPEEPTSVPPELSNRPVGGPVYTPPMPPPSYGAGAYPPPPPSPYGAPYNAQQGWQPPYPGGAYPGGANIPPQNGWQNPPPPPPPNQWTFNDYGPLGDKPPRPKKEKPPKEPRQPRGEREKEPKKPSPNRGLKVFAVIISILFVLTTAGFSTYIVYDIGREKAAPPAQSQQGGAAGRPQLDIREPSGGSSTQTPTQTNPEDALSGNQIFTKVEPAVVGIVGYVNTTIGYQEESEGSGIVFDPNGYIITNAHVVTQENSRELYDKVSVVLSNGENYPATIEGADPETDLAVIKIEASGLTVAEFGDSEQVKVGDSVFVIGNPNGLKFAGSMAGGFVSAVNRELRVENMTKNAKYIQTDAAINPGNSGGALVNVYGQVIGITSAKLVQTGFEGMGFAIPINDAKPIVESLIQNGYVAGRVQLGIRYQAISEAISELNGLPRGLRVAEVTEDADQSVKEGLQAGDIITKMDGREVFDSETVAAVLEGKKPGDTLILTIYRVDFDTGRADTFDVTVLLSEKRS